MAAEPAAGAAGDAAAEKACSKKHKKRQQQDVAGKPAAAAADGADPADGDKALQRLRSEQDAAAAAGVRDAAAAAGVRDAAAAAGARDAATAVRTANVPLPGPPEDTPVSVRSGRPAATMAAAAAATRRCCWLAAGCVLSKHGSLSRCFGCECWVGALCGGSSFAGSCTCRSTRVPVQRAVDVPVGCVLRRTAH